MDEVLELAKEGMEEAIERLRKSLTKVRTGRANPAMLDGVRVDNYGSMMPLNQVSTVSVATRACWWSSRGTATWSGRSRRRSTRRTWA
jgi:ribosome recycling factor